MFSECSGLEPRAEGAERVWHRAWVAALVPPQGTRRRRGGGPAHLARAPSHAAAAHDAVLRHYTPKRRRKAPLCGTVRRLFCVPGLSPLFATPPRPILPFTPPPGPCKRFSPFCSEENPYTIFCRPLGGNGQQIFIWTKTPEKWASPNWRSGPQSLPPLGNGGPDRGRMRCSLIWGA